MPPFTPGCGILLRRGDPAYPGVHPGRAAPPSACGVDLSVPVDDGVSLTHKAASYCFSLPLP